MWIPVQEVASRGEGTKHTDRWQKTHCKSEQGVLAGENWALCVICHVDSPVCDSADSCAQLGL